MSSQVFLSNIVIRKPILMSWGSRCITKINFFSRISSELFGTRFILSFLSKEIMTHLWNTKRNPNFRLLIQETLDGKLDDNYIS